MKGVAKPKLWQGRRNQCRLSQQQQQERQVMRTQLIRIIPVSAACLALSAQAQTSADRSSANPAGTVADQSSQSTHQPGYDASRHAGALSRMGNQEVRASKIIGADVKNLQGQSVGTINDVIFNPASGRIDFAVISLSSSSGSQSSTSTATTSPPTPDATSSSGSSAGKLAAVPWMLLRSSAMAGSGLSATTSSTSSPIAVGQPAFTFAGDTSKLQSAMTFEQSNWPDITQFSWRQSIYAHFGMTPGSSTGGASSPGGTESNSGASSNPNTRVPLPGTTYPNSSSPPVKPPQ